MQQADERQRDRLHRNAEMHDDHCRHDLARELHPGRQFEAVVEGSDDRYHRRGQQHAKPQFVVFVVAAREPDEDRDERAREDRKASKQRRWTLREAPLAGFVDRADGPREPHRERRQHRRHGRGGQEGIKRVELVRMRHRLAHSIAGAGVEKRVGAESGPPRRLSNAGCRASRALHLCGEGLCGALVWLLQERRVVAHRQLRLDLSDGFKRHANDDQHRHATRTHSSFATQAGRGPRSSAGARPAQERTGRSRQA
jgi:hypothetical protein